MTATPNSAILPQTKKRGGYAFTSASVVGTFYTAYTAGANGSIIKGIIASDIGIAENVTWQIRDVSNNLVFNVSCAVALNAGSPPVSGGGPTQPLLSPALTSGFPVDAQGNCYFFLNPGEIIQVSIAYSISGGQNSFVMIIGEDY